MKTIPEQEFVCPSVGNSLRVLIADDNSDFCQSLGRILNSWGYQAHTVSTGVQAWEIICTDPPDVALLDWVMPGMNGLEVCGKVRHLLPSQRPYVLLLSGKSQTDDIVTGLEAGADDYIVKPVDFLELRARLQVGFRIVTLQRELSRRALSLEESLEEVRQLQAEAEIARQREHYLAFHDALTGLPNRQLLFDRLHHAISHAGRSGSLLGLLLIDLDGFKFINDSLGHHSGDQVLNLVSQRLRSCLRDSDTVARLGGDEFAVVACGLGKVQDAAAVAAKIMQSLADSFVVENQRCQIGASIGISFYPADGTDAEALLRRADIAMYRAKSSGKNHYVFYDRALETKALGADFMESDLRQALVRDDFVLHFQPRVSLATRGVTGAEALLRWRHDGATALTQPQEFISLAEESGLIIPIGAWALRTACQEHCSWRVRNSHPLGIAVNLSARQFRGIELVETVADVLRETQIDPSALELEITESVAMQNLDQSIATLVQLKKMGVRLALDDFGVGYSSLSYLRHFPIDFLKIDRSFVHGITHHDSDAAITATIITLAHNLGIGVIAEGVETVAQWESLRDMGCDEAQGFLLSRPVEAVAMRTLLASGPTIANVEHLLTHAAQ